MTVTPTEAINRHFRKHGIKEDVFDYDLTYQLQDLYIDENTDNENEMVMYTHADYPNLILGYKEHPIRYEVWFKSENWERIMTVQQQHQVYNWDIIQADHKRIEEAAQYMKSVDKVSIERGGLLDI
jgi:hypothetical protein